jgi:hypothetical protein
MLWFWQDQFHQMSVKTIPYSQFKQYLADGELAECQIQDLEISLPPAAGHGGTGRLSRTDSRDSGKGVGRRPNQVPTNEECKMKNEKCKMKK